MWTDLSLSRILQSYLYLSRDTDMGPPSGLFRGGNNQGPPKGVFRGGTNCRVRLGVYSGEVTARVRQGVYSEGR